MLETFFFCFSTEREPHTFEEVEHPLRHGRAGGFSMTYLLYLL
jgi:hypothetical protein